jgi:hypothetical protein
MSVVITNLSALTGVSAAGTSSYTTSSWTPAANRLYLVAITTRTGITADPNIPTVSGNSLTWLQQGSVLYDDSSSSRRRVTLFSSMGAAPTTDVLTIDEASQLQTDVGWLFDEVTGMDTSGANGSGAIVQAVTNKDVVGNTTLAVTLSAFSSPNNVAYGAFGYTTAGGAITPGSGFSQLGDAVLGGSSTRVTTEWQAANATSVGFSPDGTQQIGGIALEIKAAVAGGVTAYGSTLSMMGV